MAGKSTKIGPEMPGLEVAKAEGSASDQIPSGDKTAPAPTPRRVDPVDNRPKNAAGEFLAPLLDDKGKPLPCEYRGTRGNMIRFN